MWPDGESGNKINRSPNNECHDSLAQLGIMHSHVGATKMKLRDIALSPRWGYVLLFLISLIIPLIHTLLVDGELEHHRYSWGLMPAELLFIRWFGQMARFGPVIALALLACSWKFKNLNSPAAIARVSVAFYFLTTLFAGYCCALIWMLLRQ